MLAVGREANEMVGRTPGSLRSIRPIQARVLPGFAVGGAIADNPVAYLIPCHRVIRSSGRFETDSRWGTARKRALIGWETAHALAD